MVMTEVFISLLLGATGYLIIKFFIDPVHRILALRQEMHESILQYSNIWGIDPHDKDYSVARQHAARERYRELGAKGEAEYENIKFNNFYFFARIYLCMREIKLDLAAKKFWELEADATQPDNAFRKSVVDEIRGHLKLPEEKKT